MKISEARLRQIVIEELQSLHEAVDHEGVKNVVTSASKLLKSAEDFKGAANGVMTNAVTPLIDDLIKILEQMVHNPVSYVDVPKPEVKRVSLRKVDG